MGPTCPEGSSGCKAFAERAISEPNLLMAQQNNIFTGIIATRSRQVYGKVLGPEKH
jgi:hypothetical protein